MNKPKAIRDILPTSLRHNAARYRARIKAEKATKGAFALMPANTPPPSYFTPPQAEVWRDILATVPAGVLAVMDTLMLGTLCDLESRRRVGRITPFELGLLLKIYKACRLTPIDRGNLSLKPPEPKLKNPFQQFA